MLATLSPTARSLARLLASWLAVLLLVQGLAAAQGRAMGDWHRHAPAQSPSQSQPTGTTLAGIAFRHAASAPGHQHGGLQRHVHAPSDATVLPVEADPQQLAAEAAAALAAMTALPQAALLARATTGATHVLRPAGAWQPRSAVTLPLRRPPRR